ncbi:MAG TPA: hypothetical protein VJ792_05970 [Candidatus Nitrosotalea sp.]|nr:hypothetical protein [Candidatus Nitrosotalea sp.]HJU13986.1 hypothetical protein [Candidatus Nitrosotalea sp.]
MRRLLAVVLGLAILGAVALPLAVHVSLATPWQHKGPVPFPPSLIPPIDPNNHHHLVKKHIVPIGHVNLHP